MDHLRLSVVDLNSCLPNWTRAQGSTDQADKSSSIKFEELRTEPDDDQENSRTRTNTIVKSRTGPDRSLDPCLILHWSISSYTVCIGNWLQELMIFYYWGVDKMESTTNCWQNVDKLLWDLISTDWGLVPRIFFSKNFRK